MTTPTFTWLPNVDPNGTIKLRTFGVQFGDGYSMDVGDGLNTKTKTWPLSFDVDDTTATAIIAFFDAQAGYQSFYWTPPLGVQGYYQVKEYGLTPRGSGWNTISATFMQVFRP